MSGINNLQTRWRKDFFRISVFFAIVCLASEVLLYSADLLFSDSFAAGPSYRAAHFYLPIVVDALAILAVRTRITSKSASNGVKNAWTCVLLLVICCSEQMIHYNCGALFCLPCLAVFMSALFADERISLRLTVLGCISTLVSGFFHARSGTQSFSVLVDINVGLIILWMSYVATRLIISYVREQFFVISNSSNREKELLYKLRLDPLMGIYNRGGMDKIIDQLITNFDESRPMSIVMIDLDHFKKINDTYGHIEGDRALVLVSNALKKACGRLGISIFLCRYGGDEFMLVAQTETPQNVLKLIHDCLQEEIANREGPSYALHVSLGYALWDGDIANFKDCVASADQKMYEDKRSAA